MVFMPNVRRGLSSSPDKISMIPFLYVRLGGYRVTLELVPDRISCCFTERNRLSNDCTSVGWNVF
ncbi:hypothetical protein BDP27DRAFT_1321466 [Rhodocollybia butyracea]|uniref:Uncharacterized protein n=1 Tax=Rhodocollybia butyracea TaxID=206335 RepID=A0A9P5U9B1_9AGAR|nr:hypothetical protein BDP27DRAFT_1321466 [Rhodocollybia butyracea]